MNLFNTWQLNVVLALISVVVYFQFYKLAVRNAKRDGAATILLQLIAGGFALLISPLFAYTFPTDVKVYLLLGLASIFYTLNDRLQTTSRKHLQVSVYSILSQTSNVFLIAIGLTFFAEPFTFLKIIGAGLIIVGNAFVFYKKGEFQINKYAWIGVVANFLFAIAISIDIGISQQFNLLFYIMLTLIVPAVMLVAGERIKISEVVGEYNSLERKYYLVTGVAWALLIFFTLRAFKFGEVTTIVPLQATGVLLNVLVAYFFMGEKKDELKKIIAAIFAMVGVALTVFG